MRKRIFSRLMAMFMAVALLSTSALAFDVTQKYIDDLEVKTDYYGNGWVTLNEEGNNYTLAEDIDTQHTLKFSNTEEAIILDLNGKIITHVGDTGSVIWVGNNTSLVLNDGTAKKDEEGNYTSTGEGVITGGKGTGCTAWYLTDYPTGGGVTLSGGSSFEMNRGSIKGNTADSGGAIGSPEGTGYDPIKIVINNGAIQENTSLRANM